MAHIGMKYPVAAPWKEDGTYGEGFRIGMAIKFSGTSNKNDVTLYADDGVAETDKSIKDYGVSLNVDDIALKVQADLLGHGYVPASEPEEGEAVPESMDVGSEDVAPYMGVGFYKRRKKNNVTTFTVIWLYKTQFSEPNEEAESKGESPNFQTPTIEGTAYPTPVADAGGEEKMKVVKKLVFKREADAVAWLNKMANIGQKPAEPDAGGK